MYFKIKKLVIIQRLQRVSSINKKNFTEKICPLCGVNLQEIDVEKHYEVELEILLMLGYCF